MRLSTEKDYDQELMRKAKDADMDAFCRLMEPKRPYIFRTACAYLFDKNDYDANEIVTKTLLKAWRYLSSFDEKSELCTWLHTITRNCCIDYGRSKHRKLLTEPIDDVNPGRLSLVDANIKSDTEVELKNRVYSCLNEAIKRLTPNQRQMIHLRYWENDGAGFQYDKIADILDLKRNTVGSVLSKTRDKLKKMVKMCLRTTTARS